MRLTQTTIVLPESVLVEKYYKDEGQLVSRLYRTIEYLKAGDLDAAKDELWDIFRYTERTQAAFDEMAMLADMLLEELREGDEKAASMHDTSPAEDALLELIENLSTDEDIPF